MISIISTNMPSIGSLISEIERLLLSKPNARVLSVNWLFRLHHLIVQSSYSNCYPLHCVIYHTY